MVTKRRGFLRGGAARRATGRCSSSAVRFPYSLPLVRASALLPSVHFLQTIGTPIDELLRASKLNVGSVHDPGALLPLRNVGHFLNAAADREQIPSLGLRVGLQTRIDSLGPFGLIVRNAVTLWDAFCTAQRLVATMNSGFGLHIEREGDTVWITHRKLVSPFIGDTHADGFGLALFINLIRLYSGASWSPSIVWLSTPNEMDLADFEVFRTTSVRFRRGVSGLAVPLSLLNRPLPSTDQSSQLSVQSLAEHLQRSAPAQDFCGSIRQYLRVQIPGGFVDIRAAAEAAGRSVRTLQRHLEESGTDYSRLLEQTRFSMAVELLRDADLKAVDIAMELGYGDAANFTRAFRRWSGLSPLDFRRQESETGENS